MTVKQIVGLDDQLQCAVAITRLLEQMNDTAARSVLVAVAHKFGVPLYRIDLVYTAGKKKATKRAKR